MSQSQKRLPGLQRQRQATSAAAAAAAAGNNNRPLEHGTNAGAGFFHDLALGVQARTAIIGEEQQQHQKNLYHAKTTKAEAKVTIGSGFANTASSFLFAAVVEAAKAAFSSSSVKADASSSSSVSSSLNDFDFIIKNNAMVESMVLMSALFEIPIVQLIPKQFH